MSRENVELVRRVFRSFNDRGVDAWLACHIADVEWRLISGFADLMGAEFKGHEGLRRFLKDWVGNLGVTGEMEALVEMDDRVVVIVRGIAAGAASGAPATIRSGQVYFFREGLISAVDNYYEAGDALAAAGLSEQDIHSDSA